MLESRENDNAADLIYSFPGPFEAVFIYVRIVKREIIYVFSCSVTQSCSEEKTSNFEQLCSSEACDDTDLPFTFGSEVEATALVNMVPAWKCF